MKFLVILVMVSVCVACDDFRDLKMGILERLMQDAYASKRIPRILYSHKLTRVQLVQRNTNLQVCVKLGRPILSSTTASCVWILEKLSSGEVRFLWNKSKRHLQSSNGKRLMLRLKKGTAPNARFRSEADPNRNGQMILKHVKTGNYITERNEGRYRYIVLTPNKRNALSFIYN